MPRKKQETKKTRLPSLPDKNSPDYFRALVRNCIAAYSRFTNDGLSLDYCKVIDQKLRAMVLADDEYKCETKSIYAQQRLEELEEFEELKRLAANEEDDDGDDRYNDATDPRNRGRAGKRKHAVDKDTLTMRVKAAQLKREIRAEMASASHDVERDAVYMMFVPAGVEDFTQSLDVEIHEGSDDDGLDELVKVKEAVPEGTSGKLQNRSRNRYDDEPFEQVLENGEIVEL